MKKLMILMLLAATVAACNQAPCPEKSYEAEYLAEQAKNAVLAADNTQLRIDTTALRGELLCLQSRLIANGLPVKCIDETPVAKATQAAPAKPARKAPAKKQVIKPAPVPPTPVVQRESAPVKSAPTIQPEPVRMVQVDISAEKTPTVYDLFYDQSKGYGEAVVQINNLDGGHIPHLTMMKGYKFKEVCDNIQGTGYNFVIRYTTPGFTEDYGLTDDGILYVKKKIVDFSYKWKINSVDFRFTGHWNNVPAQLMNDEHGTVYGVNIMYLLQ